MCSSDLQLPVTGLAALLPQAGETGEIRPVTTTHPEPTVKYRITYATSSDRYSAKHESIVTTASLLAGWITKLQAKGRVIVSVSQRP